MRPVSSPYMTRAAIRPDRRLNTSHPEVPATRQAESAGKLHYVLQTSRNAWNRRRAARDLAQAGRIIVPPLCGLSVAKAQKRLSSPEQHEADGCASPASSTGPIRAKRHGAAAGLAVSSPKPAAKKWALRPPSRAQRRQRRPYGRARPPMGDASRSELSNPGLRGPNAKRAPGRPVCP